MAGVSSSSPRRPPPPPPLFLAAVMVLGLLAGAATCGRATTRPLSSYQNSAEDKSSRLGSTPPSCHGRCDACDPCTPVQVATIPGHRRAGDEAAAAAFAQYPNYKPMGWKCRCAGRLYNP